MDASLLALAKSIYTTATHEITRTTSGASPLFYDLLC